MPEGQNIIELGFNVEQLSTQKKQILDILLEIYNAAQKIDGTQLKPLSLPGFSDLKNQTDAQKKAVDELSLSLQEYNKIQTQRAQTDAKIAAAGSDAAKQLAEQKVQLQQVNTENKNAALQALGLSGAYKELSQQFVKSREDAKNLQAQYQLLSDAEKKTQIGQGLKQQADQASAAANTLNDKLKAIDASVGNFQRNVGNYTGAISILEKSFNDVKEQLAQMTAAGETSGAQFENLSKQYNLLNIVVSENAKGFTSLQQELRTNERALQTLAEQGLQNTDVFKQLQTTVANAKREFNEFAQNQKILESEAPLLTGLTVAAKGLAGAYAVGAGAAALFADGDEKVEKELNKLVAVMTLLQGLEEAYRLVKEKSAIATALQTTATNIGNAAQKIWQATMFESVAATVAFRVALIGLTGGLLLLLPLLALGASSMDSYKEKQHDAELQQEALNDVNQKASEQYADQIVKLQSLKARFEETNATAKTKKEVTDELNKSFGEYGVSLKNASETETFLKDQAADFIKMLDLKTKATAALALATDEYKKVLQNQTKATSEFVDNTDAFFEGIKSGFTGLFSTDAERVADATDKLAQKAKDNQRQEVADSQKKYQDLLKLAEDYQNQADALSSKTQFGTGAKNGDDKKAEEQAKKEAEAEFQLSQFRIQVEADTQKKISDDNTKGLQERLKALQDYQTLATVIIQNAAQHEIEVNKLTGAAAVLVREKAVQDINKLNEEVQKQAISLNEDAIANTRAQMDQFRQEQARQAEAIKNDKLAKEKELQDGIIAIGDETYNKEKARLAQSEKDEAESDKKKLELKKQLTEKEKELASDIVDLTASLFTDGYERQKNAIQQVKDADDERYQQEITNIQNSTLSEQDKAAKITELQAEQHENDLRLDKQKRDVQNKEAKVQKAQSEAQIIIHTAEAIAEALPNIPLSIAVGAIGAVELAKVAATPIPQYAEGTDSHPGGLAVVGEGKHEELVNLPSGQSFIADKPMLLDLPLHTQVIPLSDDINQMANRAMMINTARMLEPKGENMEKLMDKQTKSIVSALSKNKANVRVTTNTKIDLGWYEYLKKNVYGRS